MSAQPPLEQRVQALEQQTQADQLTPGVFNINAAGELEAQLSGKLEAAGILFELGKVIGSNVLGPGVSVQHEIAWRTETGLPIATVSAYTYAQKPPGLQHGDILQLLVSRNGNQVGLRLFNETAPEESDALEAFAGLAGIGQKGATLIDSAGRSTFLKLLGALAARTLAFGSVLLEWKASTNATGLEVAHGLPGEPLLVIACSNNAAAFGRVPLCNTYAYTPTHFNLNAEVKEAFTGTSAVSWLAIG